MLRGSIKEYIVEWLDDNKELAATEINKWVDIPNIDEDTEQEYIGQIYGASVDIFILAIDNL